jgi:hypothetical protein
MRCSLIVTQGEVSNIPHENQTERVDPGSRIDPAILIGDSLFYNPARGDMEEIFPQLADASVVFSGEETCRSGSAGDLSCCRYDRMRDHHVIPGHDSTHLHNPEDAHYGMINCCDPQRSHSH